MSSPQWGVLQKARFVLGYGFGKLALLWDVQSPKWAFFAYECRYSLTNLANSLLPGVSNPKLYSGSTEIRTTRAVFKIRPGTHDAAIISPAFERQDQKYLDRVLLAEEKAGAEIHFLDVGANIGAFAVRVARGFPRAHIWAFEPAPQNADLLEANLQLNAALSGQVKVFRLAASDRDGVAQLNFTADQPGNSALSSAGNLIEVKTQAIDDLLPNLPHDKTTLVIKIDVEGHELPVLRGLARTMSGRRTWVFVEDIFHREELYAELQRLGFNCEAKLTPYNSWWLRA